VATDTGFNATVKSDVVLNRKQPFFEKRRRSKIRTAGARLFKTVQLWKAGYRLPSSPLRLQACSLPQETNMEYGLDINGNPCSSAIAITSGGGFLPLTNTTAPTPATMAVRITCTVAKPVNNRQSSESAARMSLIKSLAPHREMSLSNLSAPVRSVAFSLSTTSDSFIYRFRRFLPF
jgi:hypothetical protein